MNPSNYNACVDLSDLQLQKFCIMRSSRNHHQSIKFPIIRLKMAALCLARTHSSAISLSLQIERDELLELRNGLKKRRPALDSYKKVGNSKQRAPKFYLKNN